MNLAMHSRSVRSIKHVVAVMVVIALAACGKEPAGSGDVAAAQPQADTAMVAESVAAAAASAETHPLCDKATYAEVSAVTGGNFDKLNVIDVADLHYLECVFLDSRDLYAGLTIRFMPTAKLVATSSQWPTAAAYFKEWSRGGEPVSDLGERAVWTELPEGLLVLAGDQAVEFSGSKVDLSDPTVRVKFETLARQVVARLP